MSVKLPPRTIAEYIVRCDRPESRSSVDLPANNESHARQIREGLLNGKPRVGGLLLVNPRVMTRAIPDWMEVS